MAVSLAALPLQPSFSTSTESVSPRSLLSPAAAVLALQRRRDPCAWAMETWACPHHWSAWKRGLGSSLELCGEGEPLGNRTEHGCLLFSSAQHRPQGICKTLTLAVVLGQGEFLSQATGKTEPLLFHLSCRGKFNTISQAHVLPWPTTQETSISYPHWPIGSSSVPVKNHITPRDLCSRDTLTKNLAM